MIWEAARNGNVHTLQEFMSNRVDVIGSVNRVSVCVAI